MFSGGWKIYYQVLLHCFLQGGVRISLERDLAYCSSAESFFLYADLNLFRIKGLREYQVLTVCMCKEVMKSVDHLFSPSGLGSVFYLSLSAWQAVILQKTCYWLVLVIFVYVPSCGVS